MIRFGMEEEPGEDDVEEGQKKSKGNGFSIQCPSTLIINSFISICYYSLNTHDCCFCRFLYLPLSSFNVHQVSYWNKSTRLGDRKIINALSSIWQDACSILMFFYMADRPQHYIKIKFTYKRQGGKKNENLRERERESYIRVSAHFLPSGLAVAANDPWGPSTNVLPQTTPSLSHGLAVIGYTAMQHI